MSATAKESSGQQCRDDTRRLSGGIELLSEDLVERRPTGSRFAVGWFGRECAGRAIEVGIDPAFVAADLVDTPNDEQLALELLKGLHRPGEPFGLQGRRHAEAKEEVEGAYRRVGCRREHARRMHCIEEGKADRDGTCPLQHRSATEYFSVLHRRRSIIVSLPFASSGSARSPRSALDSYRRWR